MNSLSHKIRLDPTYKQVAYFRKACGTARFAWNWALAKWEEKYKAGIKTSAFELKKEFNALKKSEFSWTYEVTKYASQQPFIHLQTAFQNFFDKKAKYPKYKKRNKHDSFYIGGDQLKIIGNKVKIPNLGWVRLREPLRFVGKINGATISRTADYWFISVNVETNQRPKPCENQARIGVDLGIQNLAVFSNGEVIPNIHPLKSHFKKLKRLQRKLSKKQKGSKNRNKAKGKIAKLHYKIYCQTNDNLHKLTTSLTSNYRHIVIEDLDVSEMLKNRTHSRSIHELGWFEFRRQLVYKSKLKGNIIYIADKWYTSTKTCSSCGNRKEKMSLSERIYYCVKCHYQEDRDINAAKTLENLLNTASSAEIEACGQGGSVVNLKMSLQPAWMNQELSPV